MPPRTTSPVRLLLLSLALALAALAAEPAADPSGERNPVLVEIGDEEVRREEFVLYLRQSKPGLAFDRLPPAEKRRLVEEFVERRLLALRAREEGLAEDPDVRMRIAFFTDGVLGQALRARVLDRFEVTEAEARAYYEAHREEFRLPPRYLLTHLLYARSESAAEARARLEDDAPFEELAVERGRDPNLRVAEQRWLTPDLLIPGLAETAAELEIGEVSAVVESEHGHHLLRLEDLEPARYREFEAARSAAERKVRQGKATAVYRELLEEARRRHPVRIRLDLPTAE